MAVIKIEYGPVFDVREPLPLRGFPAGKIRLRLRNGTIATAFVKTETGIKHFAITERDGFWEPLWFLGENLRAYTDQATEKELHVTP